MTLDLLNIWWVWALAGVGLLALEVIAPGFMFLGFGVGAGVVALLLATSLVNIPSAGLVLIFALVSLGAWFAMRKVFGVRTGQVKKWDIDINDDV